MTFETELKAAGLYLVEVAATPASPSSQHGADMDPHANKALGEALRIYSRHYLKTENGIAGEGESVADVLSRLRGEDPNVPRMTVMGVADDKGKLQGVAFMETYRLSPDAGKEGLSHLVTYAAMEPKHASNFAANAAFHEGIVSRVKDIDRDLGVAPGNSVIVGEVNATRGYDGKPTSSKMDTEFEIKTGVPRQHRAEYELGGTPRLITVSGPHSNTHIVQNSYIPPELAEGGLPPGIKTAADLAPHLRNQSAFNGEGEPLFLVAKSVYSSQLKPEDIALLKEHDRALTVSVAHGNYAIAGVTDNRQLVLAARAMVPEYAASERGLDSIAQQVAAQQSGMGRYARESSGSAPEPC